MAIAVHPNADVLASAVAARLITRLVDVQVNGGEPSVVLTGGRIGTAALRAVAVSPARDAVRWSAVHFWWGDERFLPAGDPDRNETRAREALLDHIPIDPSKVHPMPAAGAAFIDDPDAAAAEYAALIADAELDVVLLGVGSDGHVASLFPGHPALSDDRPAVAVRNAPKPPPTRISLSMPVIHRAIDVWLVVAGEDKAEVVHRVIDAQDATLPATQAIVTPVPARTSSLWLIDAAAASKLQW